MAKIKLLIFDFDGTIADTKHIYYAVMARELKFLGYKEKDIDKAIDVGFSLRKTLKKLGLSFIVSWFIHKKIFREIIKYAEKVKKCRDAEKIKELSGEKILISNSLKEFMLPIIRHFKLEKNFKEIYGAEDFDDKAEFIKDYLKKRKIKVKNCYYIGDRVSDVKVARKVGCLSIIIAGKCAWDSKKEILKAEPDFVINDIGEIKKILK